MNRTELEAAVASARPGDTITYYVGHLPFDRSFKTFDGGNHKIIENLGDGAWALMEAGKVHLVQRRTGREHEFRYHAVVRPRPHKPVEWMGCYAPDPLTPPLRKAA